MDEAKPVPPEARKSQAVTMRRAKRERAEICSRLMGIIRSHRASRKEVLIATMLYSSLKGIKLMNGELTKMLSKQYVEENKDTTEKPENLDLYNE